MPAETIDKVQVSVVSGGELSDGVTHQLGDGPVVGINGGTQYYLVERKAFN